MGYIRKKNIYLSCYYRNSKVEIVIIRVTYNFSYHLPGSNIIDMFIVELTIDVGKINNREKRFLIVPVTDKYPKSI